MYREAGLPRLTLDLGGERQLILGSKGVVRTVRNDLRRVDVETEDGSLLTHVLVLGPYLPPVHIDEEQPSHVAYLHVRGAPDAWCWPIEWRRLQSPADQVPGQEGQEVPERRRYDLHGYVFRSGDITTRITHDHRWVIESEEGDYIQYDQATREVRVHSPSVYVGTEKETRREYQRDDYIKDIMDDIYIGTDTADRIQYNNHEKVQIVIPKFLFGATGVQDADGMTYIKDTLIHLLSTLVVKLTAGLEIDLIAPLIKLTASQIILDPVNIQLGTGATERIMLGDLFLAFYNVFVTLFNAHVHTGVQTGGGSSGPPATPTAAMTDALLSDIAHVAKTGV